MRSHGDTAEPTEIDFGETTSAAEEEVEGGTSTPTETGWIFGSSAPARFFLRM